MSCALPTLPERRVMRWDANIRRTGWAASPFDQLDELPDPGLVGMPLGQVPANPCHDAPVVSGPTDQVEDLLLRFRLREPEFQRIGTVDLMDMRLVEDKKRNGVRSQGLEQAWRDQPHMGECRPNEHQVE